MLKFDRPSSPGARVLRALVGAALILGLFSAPARAADDFIFGRVRLGLPLADFRAMEAKVCSSRPLNSDSGATTAVGCTVRSLDTQFHALFHFRPPAEGGRPVLCEVILNSPRPALKKKNMPAAFEALTEHFTRQYGPARPGPAGKDVRSSRKWSRPGLSLDLSLSHDSRRQFEYIVLHFKS